MAAVRRSVLVKRFSPAQLYAVVSDVQSYEKFVPWVVRSRVVRHIDVRVRLVAKSMLVRPPVHLTS
jgi:ribosome-associated toxin RatA of RatAB toxin-antitoxin module